MVTEEKGPPLRQTQKTPPARPALRTDADAASSCTLPGSAGPVPSMGGRGPAGVLTEPPEPRGAELGAPQPRLGSSLIRLIHMAYPQSTTEERAQWHAPLRGHPQRGQPRRPFLHLRRSPHSACAQNEFTRLHTKDTIRDLDDVADPFPQGCQIPFVPQAYLIPLHESHVLQRKDSKKVSVFNMCRGCHHEEFKLRDTLQG